LVRGYLFHDPHFDWAASAVKSCIAQPHLPSRVIAQITACVNEALVRKGRPADPELSAVSDLMLQVNNY
jgi:hypothetical protein